jgi:hypothetical protein
MKLLRRKVWVRDKGDVKPYVELFWGRKTKLTVFLSALVRNDKIHFMVDGIVDPRVCDSLPYYLLFVCSYDVVLIRYQEALVAYFISFVKIY